MHVSHDIVATEQVPCPAEESLLKGRHGCISKRIMSSKPHLMPSSGGWSTATAMLRPDVVRLRAMTFGEAWATSTEFI